MYNQEELTLIQNVIANNDLTDDELKFLHYKFNDGLVPLYLIPFVKLALTHPDLFEKLERDVKVTKYSVFGFFPETFDLIYCSDHLPEISIKKESRGLVGLIKHPSKNIIIKPIQSKREPEIALIADKFGIGPKQYMSLDNFLTEQFVEGNLFTKLSKEQISIDMMYILGQRIANMLIILHSQEILYNDTLLANNLKKSHIIITQSSPAILIDYGAAIKLDNHPYLSDEEVFNFVRSISGFNLFSDNLSNEQARALVKESRPKLENISKEQLLNRDLDFINDTLVYLEFYLGNNFTEAFSLGFNENYRR